MRRLLWILALTALGLGGVEASAGTLPFSGSLGIALLANGFPVNTIGVSGTGLATVDGVHIDTLSLPASPFSAAGITVPNTSMAGPLSGLQLTVHNDAGAFAGGPLNGPMALHGAMRLCFFAVCNATFNPGNITVPLDVVGAGGTLTVASLVDVTVSGAPWTAGTAAVGSLTAMGFQHGPASLTSSTGQSSGALRLVTPIYLSTSQEGIPYAAFGILDVHFIPEPGTLLLLGCGIAGLVLFGRTKRT